jgi:dihydropteroate synthase
VLKALKQSILRFSIHGTQKSSVRLNYRLGADIINDFSHDLVQTGHGAKPQSSG